jgi:hypothetical protein
MGEKLNLDLYVLRFTRRDGIDLPEGSEPKFLNDAWVSRYGGDYHPMLFTNHDAAANYAKGRAYSWGSDDTVVVEPLSANLWRSRELVRMGVINAFIDAHWSILPVDSENVQLPLNKPGWSQLDTTTEGREILRKYMPHRSSTDPTKIAYTEDEAKGAADRQTVTKPGRFLTKFCADMFTPEKIAEMANQFVALAAPGELKFATTADEIEHVYTNGPSSCMAYTASNYASPYHPTRVYAGFDLAVAYVLRGNDITARALCWPDKKRYGRVYGDSLRLEKLLEAQGYVAGSLEGARFTRDEDSDGAIICPYIDGCRTVEDMGDHMVIGGSINADSTDGLLEAREYCECCGDYHDPDDMVWVNEERICGNCRDNDYVWSERHHQYVHVDNAIEVRTRKTRWGYETDWYEHGADDDVYHCDATDEYYDGSYISPVEMANGEVWNEHYFADHGFTCAVTDENHPIDEMVDHPDHGPIHKDTDEAKALSELAEAA